VRCRSGVHRAFTARVPWVTFVGVGCYLRFRCCMPIDCLRLRFHTAHCRTTRYQLDFTFGLRLRTGAGICRCFATMYIPPSHHTTTYRYTHSRCLLPHAPPPPHAHTRYRGTLLRTFTIHLHLPAFSPPRSPHIHFIPTFSTRITYRHTCVLYARICTRLPFVLPSTVDRTLRFLPRAYLHHITQFHYTTLIWTPTYLLFSVHGIGISSVDWIPFRC